MLYSCNHMTTADVKELIRGVCIVSVLETEVSRLNAVVFVLVFKA